MSTDSTELTGKVVNGMIVLDQPAKLEDGTSVRVKPMEKRAEGQNPENLREMLLSFAGTIEDLPTDMALNHDHYLYGLPKKTN